MNLIPNPQSLETKKGSFTITYETGLFVQSGSSRRLVRQTKDFAGKLEKLLGYPLMLTKGIGRKGDILICPDERMNEDRYVLDIDKENIILTGGINGIWYGMQTLLQIVGQKGAVLPALIIRDAPELPNRGFYFDCSRGRVPKLSWLKRLADTMAYYKLNQLQLYIEHTYLFRDMTELWRDDTPLTAEEIMEFDQYCLERGIELVPSLSCFGHLYKLLSTKEYSHLCELENSDTSPFSVKGRMHHHTINTTKPESLELIKRMIVEFMELFSSKQFNLCADETFDLCSERSSDAAERFGRDRIYIEFVGKIAEFIIQNGKRPMFWGDIIAGFPKMLEKLPKEIICLNWGYAANQSEADTIALKEAGAVQYCCPGCSGWNRMLNSNWDAYQNIKRQCTYAVRNKAIGVLNTDWGDYHHINHPDFSITGLIYGAAFSWNAKDAEDYSEESFIRMNEQISRLEFGDPSGKLLTILDKARDKTSFPWDAVCLHMELKTGVAEDEEEHRRKIEESLQSMVAVDEKDDDLQKLTDELYRHIVLITQTNRDRIKPYLIAIEGIRLFNQTGKIVCNAEYGFEFENLPDRWKLAKQLEIWLYHYKKEYRKISKESELQRIDALVCWYGDYLRTA